MNTDKKPKANPAPNVNRKSKSDDIFRHFTVTLKGDKLMIQRIVHDTYTLHVPTEAWLRQRLEEMNGWGRPWDNFGHVIQQLRAGRTYQIRSGSKDWMRFTD